jgi:hypothetical protein
MQMPAKPVCGIYHARARTSEAGGREDRWSSCRCHALSAVSERVSERRWPE